MDGIKIEASRILHDAADPVCYTVSDTESKVGVATDFGTYDEYLVEKLLAVSPYWLSSIMT